jgi:hypothetical protein
MRSMRRKSILLMSVMRVVDVSPFGKGDVPGQQVRGSSRSESTDGSTRPDSPVHFPKK